MCETSGTVDDEPKATYASPQLVEYGTVDERTQSAGGTPTDGFGGSDPS